MSRNSIPKRSIRTAVAGLVFAGLLSPANASYQHDVVVDFHDLPLIAMADHAGAKDTNPGVAGSGSIVLTSHLPWLAPVGHRQPRRAEVPQSGAVSVWEHQQRQLDHELDRRLIICRGC